MSKLFASPLGTFLKAFLATVLSLIMVEYNRTGTICLTKECFIDLLMAGVISIIPVIMNYLNPEYKGYGVGSNPPDPTYPH
jgi:hypothetical protein